MDDGVQEFSFRPQFPQRLQCRIHFALGQGVTAVMLCGALHHLLVHQNLAAQPLARGGGVWGSGILSDHVNLTHVS